MNQMFKLVSLQPSAATQTAYRIISINSTYKCNNKSLFYINNRQSPLNRYSRSYCTSPLNQQPIKPDLDIEEDFVEQDESCIEDYFDENGNQPKNMGYFNAHFLGKKIMEEATTPKYKFDPEKENEKYDYNDGTNKSQEQGEYESQIKTQPLEFNDKQLPYDHSAKMAEKSLRTHLNRFFLKVHPDLFYNNDEHRQVNQKSLTLLNNLLRNLEEYVSVAEDSTNTTKLEKIPPQIQFRFFAEVDDNGRIVEIKQDFTFIDAPDSILTSKTALVQYATELRFNIYRQLYALLEKSGISIPKNEKELLKNPKPVATELNDDPWEEYFSKDPSKLTLSQQLNAFLDQFPVHNDTLRNQFAPEHQKLIDSFEEKKVYFYFGEQCKGDLDYMRHLGFREEAEFQIIHLKHNLLSLEFQEWSALPIIIVDSKYYNIMEPGLTKRGFVVLEKDFNPSVALSYIKEVVIPKTVSNFNSIAQQALRNREILEEKTNKLEQLFGSNVVIENLFSINQKTMDKVREDFNNAMTMVGELKIPAIQLLESNKAETWKDLPKTNLKEFEFEQWKLKNLETSENEAIAYISGREADFKKTGRVPNLESKLQESERVHNTYERVHQEQQKQEGKSDTRLTPLQLVDRTQFDVIQSTPYLNESCSAVDRLTKLFDNPTKVPFLIATKPVRHPLADLKESAQTLSESDFDQGVLKARDEEELAIVEEDEDEDIESNEKNLGEGIDEEDEEYEEDEEDEDEESHYEDIDQLDQQEAEQEEGEVKEKIRKVQILPQDTSVESLSKLSNMFAKTNIVEVEAKTVPSSLFISKIQFMTTGNNFSNITPIPISKPTISRSKDDDEAQIDEKDEKPNVSEIIQETKKEFDGISSDLEDFFSKLSQLENDVKSQPNTNESQQQQQQEKEIQQQKSEPINLEPLEKISYIEQKLSDFKWDGINLIISDHYRFIITENAKSGFCFIPSNFKEEELFVFLNSIQDSFDLINGGTKEKTQEEYRVRALLSIESNIKELKQRYNLKSVIIDNNSVPSKVAQYTFIRKFVKQMESNDISTSQIATFKSVAPYITLIISNQYSIDFVDSNGSIINNENEYSNSKSAIVNIDNLNLNASILLEYIFVTLSDNSSFFRDLISRNYNLPQVPQEPNQEKVKDIINKQYGYERIKDPKAPIEEINKDDLVFIEKETSVFDEMVFFEDTEALQRDAIKEYGERMGIEFLGELAEYDMQDVRYIKEENDDDDDYDIESNTEKPKVESAAEFLKKINQDN